MANLRQIQKRAESIGIENEIQKLISGDSRIVLSLMETIYSTYGMPCGVKLLPKEKEFELMRYLKRIKAKWEYSASYQSIYIKDKEEKENA